ncbi:MAG: type II secretion system F family protein, partial [Pseudomonadota bacterium]
MENLASPSSLAAYFTAIAMFATILTIAMPMLNGNKLETRLKSVAQQREKLRRQSREALEQKGLKRESKGVVKDINDKLDLQKLLEDPTIVNKLQQAGFRGPGPVSAFYFARFSLPFIGAALVGFYIFGVDDMGLQPMMKYGSILFGAAAGFYAPNLYVSNKAQVRQQSIMKAFSDALDMMLICVESGMSIEMAFA